MEKLLRVLMLISGNRTYSCIEIAERLNVVERTVYRYLRYIEDSGFIIERDSGYYRLLQSDSNTISLRRLLHFSEEEAYTLYFALSEINEYGNHTKKLIKKIHTLYDFQALNKLRLNNDITKINVISNAINDNNVIILKRYHSSNSDNIDDRLVEPFELMTDYEAVWCLDLEDKTVKQFKISRIDEVTTHSSKRKYQSYYKIPFTDAFRMSAPSAIANVKATLTLKAYNLLREEFPISKKHICPNNKDSTYILDIPVADYNGIGRFIMGLPGEIKVHHPEDFIMFLNEKVKQNY